jgi:hypothetical protein
MSAAGTDDPFQKLLRSLYALKRLRNATFRELAQSREDFKQLHLWLNGSLCDLIETGRLPLIAQLTAVIDACDPLSMPLGFATTALLHLQQQQRILQAIAADLAFVRIICETLIFSLKLLIFKPAGAQGFKQELLTALPGDDHRRVCGSCCAIQAYIELPVQVPIQLIYCTLQLREGATVALNAQHRLSCCPKLSPQHATCLAESGGPLIICCCRFTTASGQHLRFFGS